MPKVEEVPRKLSTAKLMDEFFGKEGVFCRLFAHTIKKILEAEFADIFLGKHDPSAADRNGELEDKIIGMYGMSARDIQETLQKLYGVDVSSSTLSAIADKVWGLVEDWQ